MSIAKRVRDCRYTKGWGPDELASRAAISRTALYQIECGKTETPRAGTLRRIAEALGVPIEALLIGEENRAASVSTFTGSAELANWSGDDAEASSRRLAKHRPARFLTPRETEVVQKFQELLTTPLGDGLSRIVEETYRMVEDARVGTMS